MIITRRHLILGLFIFFPSVLLITIIFKMSNNDINVKSRDAALSFPDEEIVQDWDFADLDQNKPNPVYYSPKTLERVGNIVSFWQKQTYDISTTNSPTSHRVNALVYEAQEKFSIDCDNFLIKGPIKGRYWDNTGNPIIPSNKRVMTWQFTEKWKLANKKEKILINKICNPKPN